MKTLGLTILACVTTASTAFAGSVSPYTTVTPSTGDGINGAIVLLVIVGGIIALNGFGTNSTRAKTPEAEAQDADDDSIMKF